MKNMRNDWMMANITSVYDLSWRSDKVFIILLITSLKTHQAHLKSVTDYAEYIALKYNCNNRTVVN